MELLGLGGGMRSTEYHSSCNLSLFGVLDGWTKQISYF